MEMKNELETARAEIDRIDGELASLFEKRMDTVNAVINYKIQNGLPILDNKRENEILEKCAKRIKNPDYIPYYAELQRKLMELSRLRQAELVPLKATAPSKEQKTEIKKVGYQGIEGAYSHTAAVTLFGDAELVNENSFEAVFDRVEKGEIDAGVIPFENSFTGTVSDTLDLLYSKSCFISRRYDLPIRHCLLGVNGATLDTVKTVRSHPQALGQCAEFISKQGLLKEECVNTAIAAAEIAAMGDCTKSAIASKEAGEIYGLSVIAEKINTSLQNTTRFIVIEREPRGGGDYFSIMFSLEHTAGELAKIIEIIAQHGFNMESIRSQSLRRDAWKYYFYIELCGSPDSDNARNMIKKLKSSCREFKLLGGYC